MQLKANLFYLIVGCCNISTLFLDRLEPCEPCKLNFTLYLAEPAVFPPLAVHSKPHLPEPPASGRKQGQRQQQIHFLLCVLVRVHACVKVQQTYLCKFADTDSTDTVVFYSNPFVLICEFKCCKITKHTQNTKSVPVEEFQVYFIPRSVKQRDKHAAASSTLRVLFSS